MEKTDAAPPAPLVSVVIVEAHSSQAELSAFAELRPRWDAELRSAVTGRIVLVEDSALAGAKVDKDDLLFSIEKTQYEAAVALAELELEQAKFEMLRARNNASVALKQFERDGLEPPTELAIQLPQLRIAEKNVASAKSRLRSAQRALADTDVRAPFSGFVTNRLASLGQTINQGDPLVHLSDDSRYELTVEISQSDWALLSHPIEGQTASLQHQDGRFLGHAQIARSGSFLDRETRQRQVFLDVTEPAESVLAGDFLKVILPGRAVPNTVTIPESALTRSGHVWIVNEGDLLERLTPKVVFRSGNTVTIAAPDTEGPWRVAQTPLASFLPGQRVTPKPAGS
ncbi:efflux RND transporter periplasmic adaptor subunit [Roseovarius sp. 2305UL8-3]|uniref:efflux RND transporter periplasmic adaptor subunit n=1 Tax=Roseovarius conchicola TaxID=3121636 RepID=UPI0035271C1B